MKQQHVTSPLKDSGPDNVGLAGANARQSVSTMLQLLDFSLRSTVHSLLFRYQKCFQEGNGIYGSHIFLQSLYAYAVVIKVG